MRGSAALLMLGATAHAQICPAPAAVATVSNDRGVTVTAANTGNMWGQVSTNPFPWIPAENVMLHPMSNAGDTLNCGAWYTLGPDRMVAAGKQVQVDCNTGVCDVYAFLYHEPPRSSDSNGGLPLTLPDATPEWSRGSCAPQFCIGSYCCNMAAYRLQIEYGGTATIPISGTTPAMYLVLAVAPGEKCSIPQRQQSQSACVSPPAPDVNALCRWEGDSCVDNWCPRRFGVPTPGGSSSGGSSSGGAPAPSCQAPLSVPSFSSEIFNTGIGTNGQILPNFQDDDAHWEVMEENTPGWVPAEYDLTLFLFSQWLEHPLGSAGSRPLAHPQFPRQEAGYPGKTFYWRQVFSVLDPATASVTYQIGFDDVSKSATGNHPADCRHTVWVNGNPINQPHFAPNPTTLGLTGPDPRWNTRCQGTLPVNTFQAGQNSIEFRIANFVTAYGFRFEKLSATGGL